MLPEKFLKPYNPQETEPRIYKLWEESGFFNPDHLPTTPSTLNPKPFSIVMPPPNVTGALHMGHALTLALEDIMVRFNRMRGRKTLWLPGADHAAIATQSRVEKDIYKSEKKSRHELGREEFLKRVEKFAAESRDTIVSQIKTMGASCDWSREAFTLDEPRSRAVRTMFKKMYDDGLIYRGHRIVNWDPKGQTTISDDEIVYEERKTKLYTFRYGKDFPIPIATTRPETKLGDVGVAVHPNGKWKKYIGQTFDIKDFAGVPLKIKIVGDDEVDPEFGTGAVGLTPSHSHTDWAIAERHGLDKNRVVINEFAKMQDAGKLADGKKVAEAREIVVGWLKENNLLEKEEEVTHNVATAERTGGVVEPLPKLQWFVNVNKPVAARGGKTLKELMREPVERGEIKIIPEHFVKTYFHWIDNLRDWCISRQIWYGHRIPVWYRKTDTKRQISNLQFTISKDIQNSKNQDNEMYVGTNAPAGEGWEQDPDTLDTWFSSGLWTFSTLGWPHCTQSATRGKPGQENDLANFHPTDVLETGYDILFFWIARMILMSEYALGQIPFRTVYLHGIVRDGQGRKFSKTLGNGIDPVDIAKEFGADAGRMALVVGNTPGTDMNISKEKVRGYKNFANKLWNITRFIMENTGDTTYEEAFKDYAPADLKLRDERHALLTEVTEDLEEFRFYLAAEKLYHYTWHAFADKILEESKKVFESGAPAEIVSRKQFLIHTLRKLLICLHPFIPFVTEEIWQLMDNKTLLMIEPWPIETNK